MDFKVLRYLFQQFKGLTKSVNVPDDYRTRVELIDDLLDNDYTGLVSTVIDFMVNTANVDYYFETDNATLNNVLSTWQQMVNTSSAIDMPRGLKNVSEQYFRERWRSSFIAVNIKWDNFAGWVLPSKIWFSDGKEIKVKEETPGDLTSRTYSLGSQELPLRNSDTTTILIRKPYNALYKKEPTPYLVHRGVLYNALLKKAIINKQTDVIEQIVPYLLTLKAGSDLAMQNGDMPTEEELKELKKQIVDARSGKKLSSTDGSSIASLAYDVALEHFMPDLQKVFNDKIIGPVNTDILAGLGLIELEGFSKTRQETVMNPKLLVEEVSTAVLDLNDIYTEITLLIVEKNQRAKRLVANKIRVVPGVVRAFITDKMLDILKSIAPYTLSNQDVFEMLPMGFDYEINKMRRKREQENGEDKIFFPKMIINQDANLVPDITEPIKAASDRAVMVKCAKCGEIFDLVRTPDKDINGLVTCPCCFESLTNKDMELASLKVSDDKVLITAPYENIDALPKTVRDALPPHAQLIFLRVFNESIKNGGTEEDAFRLAWGVVKRSFYKKPGSKKWVKKASEDIEGDSNE